MQYSLLFSYCLVGMTLLFGVWVDLLLWTWGYKCILCNTFGGRGVFCCYVDVWTLYGGALILDMAGH